MASNVQYQDTNIGSLEAKNAGGTIGYSPPGAIGALPLADQVALVISNVVGFLTVIASLAFIFYALIGSINWISAQGDPQKAQKAGQMITQAIIGITLTATAFSITYVLGKILGIPYLDPAETINNFIY